MKTLTIVLTDGPYISEYAEIAYKLARAALKQYKVNIFLYLDAVHIPKKRARTHPSLPMQDNCFPDLRKKGSLFEPVRDAPVQEATFQKRRLYREVTAEIISLE